MIGTSRPGLQIPWWRLVLAAVAAVLLGLLGARSASAVSPPSMDTRVGASTLAAGVLVGALADVSAGERFADEPAGLVVAVATGVAAKSGDDLVDVFRVVGPEEAADIAKTGAYRVQPGGEGKYFFPTQGQAENLGQMYTKAGWGGQQTLTRGQVPSSVIARAEAVNAGTEGPAWFIRSPDIPSICNVSCIGPVGW